MHSDLNIYQKCPANPQPHLLPLPVSSPTLVFLRGASQLRSCSEKSILGGGLKDLSQEYYSTARHSDKPPVTSSRDRAGQAQAPHMERGEHSALAVGRSTIMGKTWLTSLLVWAISNLRALDLWLQCRTDSHTRTPPLTPLQTGSRTAQSMIKEEKCNRFVKFWNVFFCF